MWYVSAKNYNRDFTNFTDEPPHAAFDRLTRHRKDYKRMDAFRNTRAIWRTVDLLQML